MILSFLRDVAFFTAAILPSVLFGFWGFYHYVRMDTPDIVDWFKRADIRYALFFIPLFIWTLLCFRFGAYLYGLSKFSWLDLSISAAVIVLYHALAGAILRIMVERMQHQDS